MNHIACPAEPEVDRLSSLVHRSIEVGPVAASLDIGLIDSPRAASGPAKAFVFAVASAHEFVTALDLNIAR